MAVVTCAGGLRVQRVMSEEWCASPPQSVILGGAASAQQQAEEVERSRLRGAMRFANGVGGQAIAFPTATRPRRRVQDDARGQTSRLFIFQTTRFT